MAQKQMSVAELTIVDSDAHTTEDFNEIVSYINDDHKAVRKKLERGGFDDIFSVSSPAPTNLSFYGEGKFDSSNELIDDTQGVGRSGRNMREHLDEFQFDKMVLSPTKLIAINTINDARYAVPLAEAYNQWVKEKFLDVDNRFKASILVAGKKPEKAAKEIERRAGENGFVSVALPTAGLEPPVGHHSYDHIYAAAEEHNLPLVLHSTSGSLIKTIPTFYKWSETFTESILYGHHFTQMWNLTSTIFRGLPSRFPNLKVVFQEAGIGYIPYLKMQLDDLYLENSEDFMYLDKSPSEYFGKNLFFTTQPIGHTRENPGDLRKLIEIAGVDSIMYSADFPHPTFDPPEELHNRLRTLDQKEIKNIMGETAEKVFNI